jgi:hypothetical protein
LFLAGQSFLAEGMSFESGGYRSGQTGQTVNLLAYAFAGSNPAPPTAEESWRLKCQDEGWIAWVLVVWWPVRLRSNGLSVCGIAEVALAGWDSFLTECRSLGIGYSVEFDTLVRGGSAG